MLKHFFTLTLMSVSLNGALLADVRPVQNQQRAPQQTQTQSPSAALSSTPNLLHGRMRDALIKQVSVEQYSSNLYLTYASYFDDLGLDGCAEFFRHAAAEETEHSYIFYNFLIDRNEKFQMMAVNASSPMPSSVLDGFQKHLENEIVVTRAIHNLYTIALEENDYATQAFLHPLLLMQVQEEKEAMDLVQLLEIGANDPAFILGFDMKLKEMIEED